VAQGLLWPPEDPQEPAVAAFWPSTAAGGASTAVRDIETIETILSEDTARQHLGRLFLCSLREGWGRSPAHGAAGRATMANAQVTQAPACTAAAPCHQLLGGPVLWAARRAGRGNAANEVAWLLRWRADPNEADGNGWTPLIWAAHRNAVDVCRTLLHSRADVDRIGREGSSALSIACRCSHKEVVEALFDAGASPFLVPIGNGNFDYHVGDEILQLVRDQRRRLGRGSGRGQQQAGSRVGVRFSM